jgi:hypothetical protein
VRAVFDADRTIDGLAQRFGLISAAATLPQRELVDVS